MSVKVAPSILSADFSKLADEIKKIEEAGADWIHVDVMDGHFVPNITIGPVVLKGIKDKTSLPLDVHLMIKEPLKYAPKFVKQGASIITIHQEVCVDLAKALEEVKKLGVKAGVSINPGTGLKTIESILDKVDLVLVMSVEPGFSGQKFMPVAIDKIKKLKKIREEKGLDFVIEVDGGINGDTIKRVADAGVDVVVSGNGVFGQPDITKAINKLKKGGE